MPNKDFEKQVKQKMDELNFIPSELVWQKVEEQIVERKKRRRILVWLPVLFLLVTAGTWLYKTNSATHKLQKSTAATTKQKNIDGVGGHKSTGTENEPLKSDNSKTGKIELSIRDRSTPGADKTPAKQVDKPVSQKAPANIHFIQQLHYGNEIANTSTKQQKIVSKEKDKQVAGESNIQAIAETSVAGIGYNDIDKDDDRTTKLVDTTIAMIKDSAIRKTVAIKKDNKADSNMVAAKKETVTGKKKDVELGILASIGLSGVSQGFSGFLSSPSASPVSYSASSNSPNSPVAQSSEIKPGAAYSVGFSGHRKYSKTFSLFAGINYSYYSTKIKVGQKADSIAYINQGSLGLQSVNSFYRTDNINSHNYTNHYHFIELPVGIEKQLGNGSPFSLNTGFTVSQLINSNALHYDGQKGIYYQDNKLINKTQLGFFGGVSYRLYQRNTSMEIGPQFQYGLTNLYKKELYGSRHLIFVAVSARLFFHRNKH